MRKLSGMLAVVLLCMGMIGAAIGQSYPNKAVRLIVPFPPGGPADVLGRLIAQKFSETLKQPVVIDNRGGAGGTIGAEAVARAMPDGYTLLMGSTTTLAVSPSLYRNLSYDSKKAFEPIGLFASVPLTLVVNPNVPVNSVMDHIAYAKARPGKLFYASAGNGTQVHLTGEMFKTIAGIDVIHVPYKGGAFSMTALLAGDVQYMFESIQTTLPQIRAGKIKVLAVTSATRSPMLPNAPTVAESGLAGFEVTSWNGIVAPAGTSGEIVTRLNGEIRQALATKDFVDALANMGATPTHTTPGEFGNLIAREIGTWAAVAAKAAAKLD
jgi:tripartite-type tricarboxylate transporter receptor subunit TctC